MKSVSTEKKEAEKSSDRCECKYLNNKDNKDKIKEVNHSAT